MNPWLHRLSTTNVPARLARLYGNRANSCLRRMTMLVGRYGLGAEPPPAPAQPRFSERDAILIVYGDHVQAPPEKPLAVLARFLEQHAAPFNILHLLPFFPYSSDDGFSVIHFRTVRPDLGTWSDVQRLAAPRLLMVDLVLNHLSSRSNWFNDFLGDIAPARDYILTVPPETDLHSVFRPRTHPLLTPFRTATGAIRHVWTTFSPDQVDLDYRNPDVLFEMLDILLFYVSMGARWIRLDAVAYLWKTIGTDCLHRPQTHEIVKLMRDLLSLVAPDTLLITETNVPHKDNVSYFGEGDEAHLVYQFPLPPLLLLAFAQGDASRLSQWVAALQPPPAGCTFLNFTASHDGIGLQPLRGLAGDAERTALLDHVRAAGGCISLTREPDGIETPYEANITWFAALRSHGHGSEEASLKRFLCSQAICFALQGVPAVYFGAWVAADNDANGMKTSGHARAINRHKWREEELETLLTDPDSTTSGALHGINRLLLARASHDAFHPEAQQEVLHLDRRVFAVARTSKAGDRVLCLHNVTGETVRIDLPQGQTGVRNLIADGYAPSREVRLNAYEAAWLALGG